MHFVYEAVDARLVADQADHIPIYWMGPMHLGHKVTSTGSLEAGSQHHWVLAAGEVRQNDMCIKKDG